MTRMKGLLLATAGALTLSACSDARDAPEKQASPRKENSEMAVQRWGGDSRDLPPPIVSDIRRDYTIEGSETRYVASTSDLSGDSKPEFVIHVIGPAACGTGGCTTLVFTPDAGGYRRVSTITVSSPPVRASSQRTNGWRDLIVHVSGGGAADGDVQLKYTGQGYPENPTLANAAAQSLEGSVILIPAPETFEDAALLEAASSGNE